MGCAKVAEKMDTLALAIRAVMEINLDIGGVEDMPGSLQANAQEVAAVIDQGIPGLVARSTR